MITSEELKNITDECQKKGMDIRIRDISYVLLCNIYESREVAYRTLFTSDVLIDNNMMKTYDSSENIKQLRSMMRKKGYIGKKKGNDISFEENKAYMLKIKEQTEKAIEKKEIPKKDGLKILADITTRLNDKFGANETTQEQMVVVNQKYDLEVCSYCQHEIARKPISKEEAMKLYNLVEKEE